MPHINLLPWREELRRQRQKEFGLRVVLAVIAMLGVVALVHVQYNRMIEFQEERNAYLEEEIAKLDKKIEEIQDLDRERERLLARMRIIQELQASRPEIVHLFDELVATLPDGVYYKKIAQQGRSLTLEGIAQSNARVSSLMRNLDGSDWLADPNLIEIKAEQKEGPEELRLSSFALQVKQENARATSEEDQKVAER